MAPAPVERGFNSYLLRIEKVRFTLSSLSQLSCSYEGG